MIGSSWLQPRSWLEDEEKRFLPQQSILDSQYRPVIDSFEDLPIGASDKE